MTRRRKLSAEERDLWERVAASARPIRLSRAVAKAGPAPKANSASALPPPQPAFRVGARARDTSVAVDLVPSIAEQMAAHPLRMDRRTHQQLTRGKLTPEARIDLHGMTLAEAHPELIRFILNAHGAGKRLVLVITGKGKVRDDSGPIPQRVGALRHQVPHWLAQSPLRGIVLQVTPAHLKHGGGGAFYVYLRRTRAP